jgi:hypothetical protein
MAMDRQKILEEQIQSLSYSQKIIIRIIQQITSRFSREVICRLLFSNKKFLMTTPETTLFISFAYLVVKHFLGDFVLQNNYQIAHKSHYGHPGGLLHALIHGLLSAPLFLFLTNIEIPISALIITGEVFVHYHIDWAKAHVMQKTGWDSTDKRFWRVFGFDQLLHFTTYLVMAALITGSLRQYF